MASPVQILDVHIPIEDEFNVMADKIWPRIKPQWTRDNVSATVINGGFVNHMTLYHLTSDVTKQDAYIVRLYGTPNQLLGSRESEILGMQIANRAGCFSDVMAVVRNGIIYKYSTGRILDESDMRKPHIVRQAARAIAQLHWAPTDDLPLINRAGRKVKFKRECGFITRMRENVATATAAMKNRTIDSRTAAKQDWSMILREIDDVESFLEGLDLPLANVHHDTNNNNILYDDDTGHVTLIDYEYFEYDIAVFDLSYLLEQYVWYDFGGGGVISIPSHPETEEITELWVASYLERKRELEGHNPTDQSREELKLWLLSLEIMNKVIWLYIATRFLVVMQTELQVPAYDMYQKFIRLYLERNPDLTSLRERYIHLRQLQQQE